MKKWQEFSVGFEVEVEVEVEVEIEVEIEIEVEVEEQISRGKEDLHHVLAMHLGRYCALCRCFLV